MLKIQKRRVAYRVVRGMHEMWQSSAVTSVWSVRGSMGGHVAERNGRRGARQEGSRVTR